MATYISPTIDHLTKDIYEIFRQIGGVEECILVCHSLGSLEAIRFAQCYKDKVRGIVFLDCGSPQFYEEDSELYAKFINRGSGTLRAVGLNRLLGSMGVMLPLSGENIRYPLLPDKEKALDVAMYYRYVGNGYNLKALNLMNENARAVVEGETLGDLPILVLSSDSGVAWENVQKELTAWSTNSKQLTIEGSSHYIHWSNKDQVIGEINEFITQWIK